MTKYRNDTIRSLRGDMTYADEAIAFNFEIATVAKQKKMLLRNDRISVAVARNEIFLLFLRAEGEASYSFLFQRGKLRRRYSYLFELNEVK